MEVTCWNIIQGSGTLLIASIVAYIAWQQWKTNQRKLKLDLFEHRKFIFQVTQTFLHDFLNEKEFGLHTIQKFKLDTADSSFLFGRKSKVNRKINELYKKGLKLDVMNIEIQNGRTKSDTHKNFARERLEFRTKVSNEYDEILCLFDADLNLTK